MSELIGKRCHQSTATLQVGNVHHVGAAEIKIRIEDVFAIECKLKPLLVAILYPDVEDEFSIDKEVVFCISFQAP